MLEQKFNFPMKDLSLIYHLNPKMYVYLENCVSCVVLKMMLYFENPQIPKFYQCVIPGHCASHN